MLVCVVCVYVRSYKLCICTCTCMCTCVDQLYICTYCISSSRPGNIIIPTFCKYFEPYLHSSAVTVVILASQSCLCLRDVLESSVLLKLCVLSSSCKDYEATCTLLL